MTRRIIRLDGDRPRRRKDAGTALDAAATRARGERERRRRRTTPLLEQAEVDQQVAPSPSGAGGGRRNRQGTPASPATGGPRSVQHARLLAEATDVGERLVADLDERTTRSELEVKVAAALDFLRRRITGDYEVDEFGFDAELTDTVLLNVLRPIYRSWFRVQVHGIENIPSTGGALVVANHSGTLAFDALMTQVAIRDEHPAGRHLRMLGADLVFAMPVVGEIARKSGSTLAANADAERLLAEGHVVGVWPEGFKGIGKPFSERYKLQRFGRGGFVSAALRTGTPIVPCAIVGAEEIYPILGNMRTLARLLGLPYAPVTPTWPWLGPLGLVPLPSKWLIEFGEPIPDRRSGRGRSRGPDAGVRRHRPGPGDHPADPVLAADAATVRVLLARAAAQDRVQHAGDDGRGSGDGVR